MKTIQLTQGQVALVDDEDFEFLNQWKWMAKWNIHTNSFYAVRHARSYEKVTRMNRVIMDTPEELQCDHIDGNTLNNQRHNLRNCTQSQNQMNRKRHNKNNKLGIMGVYKHRNGFRAQITKDGKVFQFPTRKNIEDAILDRQKAVKEVYGEFADNGE